MIIPTPLADLPVDFIGSYPDPNHPLAPVLPEIALLGRSNVGKSSLLNALLGRTVARVSNTPGRTALLNVFRLPGLYLLDLPGYGYAKTSHAERERYGRLVRETLLGRPSLTGVLWLLDLRHLPSNEDCAYGELLVERQLPVIVALTKSDKLPFQQRQRQLAAVSEALAIPVEQLQLTSSTTGAGISELAESLLAHGSAKGA